VVSVGDTTGGTTVAVGTTNVGAVVGVRVASAVVGVGVTAHSVTCAVAVAYAAVGVTDGAAVSVGDGGTTVGVGSGWGGKAQTKQIAIRIITIRKPKMSDLFFFMASVHVSEWHDTVQLVQPARSQLGAGSVSCDRARSGEALSPSVSLRFSRSK